MRKDITLLFVTRITRMFAYGFLSVSLALYLSRLGLSPEQIGLVFSFTLAGDAIISLWLTTNADRLGRKKILIIGAALMLMAGAVFAITRNPILLAPRGDHRRHQPQRQRDSPFFSPLKQAGLTQLIPNEKRTSSFAWYNLAGSLALAVGALAGGLVVRARGDGFEAVNADRVLVVVYAAFGIVLMALYTRVTPQAEAPSTTAKVGALGWATRAGS